MPVDKSRAIKLLSVPHYRQGSADGFCVFYSMSMMLAAMFPPLRLSLGDLPSGHHGGNPIFRFLKKRHGADAPAIIGNWALGGIQTSKARKPLEDIAAALTNEPGPWFKTGKVSLHKRPLDGSLAMNTNDLFAVIHDGFPVIFGGDPEGDGELAAHAVVAVGYQRNPDGNDLLAFLDPGGSAEEEWQPIRELLSRDAGSAYVIFPKAWPKNTPRLDFVENVNDEAIFINRWDTRRQRYVRWPNDEA